MSAASKPRRVTIDDVARSAGVSRQTVSRAINDKPEIDPETRARVLRVAQAMGYRPSRFARGMVSQGVTTLGLVIADVLNPFFPEVVSGVMEAADKLGWQVAVYSTGHATEREFPVADTVAEHVDACIAFMIDREAVDRIRASGMPFVLLDHDAPPPSAGGVRIDFEAGMRQAVGHLVHAGHRAIAMLNDRAHGDSTPRHTRRELFLDAAADHGLASDEAWVVPAENSLDGGAEAMNRLLASGPRATAVIGYNDLIAIGAMRHALTRGLTVPGDCAFVGFDGLALSQLVDPPLTTLDIDKQQLGRAAVQQVEVLMSGGRRRETVIVPELVVRASA